MHDVLMNTEEQRIAKQNTGHELEGRMYTIKFNGIQWHSEAFFGTTPEQNLMGT